ncbi:type 1 periplasmic-binding domain-containing protein [Spiroplasma cantharicola]|uniref:Ribose/galactose ABC transporter substrate-binding protein n=1 Tax=Spiroplasma cantharicola TaxID=362837 RepID=A0A0M4KDT9_9MOLU|nr:hypothetical protein [Spiroplasma cantharicola]ALD65995.1 ribose/galactose ABC transporter substrate-binding protein [Spiroplasma cantharicola]
MKKLLSGLMAGVVVCSSTSSLVSCSKLSAISEIYLVTDAGKISDKSFNESTFKAGNEFLQEVLQRKDWKISKIEPENSSSKVMKNQYRNARNNGAKIILLPGFHHAMPGEGENYAPQVMSEKGSTIFLDGESSATNEIGFSFRGDISGFYAGMSSIIWGLQQGNKYKEISLGSFGGISNPRAVDAFIVGYLAAIEVFNELKKTDEGKAKLKDFGLNDEAYAKKVKMTQSQFPNSPSDASWYSNSFQQGDGLVVSSTLMQNGANFIMPVAGPQTIDVVGLSKQKDGGDTVKVIGVDTNQAEAFPQNKNMFLTSAEKDLQNATIAGLAHTPYWIEKDIEVVGKTATYLKGKINLTEKNEETGKFESVEIDDEFPWSELEWKEGKVGRTLWVGGNMSAGGNNLATPELKEKILLIFEPDVLTQASIELFETIDNNAFEKSLINEKTIKAYADRILNGSAGGAF